MLDFEDFTGNLDFGFIVDTVKEDLQQLLAIEESERVSKSARQSKKTLSAKFKDYFLL